MSDDARPIVKKNQTFLKRVIPQPLEKIISTVLMKFKNVWVQENSYSGIQFYNDLDDLGK